VIPYRSATLAELRGEVVALRARLRRVDRAIDVAVYGVASLVVSAAIAGLVVVLSAW
jgi:hypothetical protein